MDLTYRRSPTDTEITGLRLARTPTPTGKRITMPGRIEDYALIGDMQSAALVGRDGSIDWLCFPRFDSGACFAALLGDEENGHWLIEPDAAVHSVHWRYRHETLILETEWETRDGAIRVID